MKKLLIVESPSKAKTIEKYLEGKFKVLATYGHIRDIPSKNGSVLPEKDFFMDYQINLKSKKNLDLIYAFVIDSLKISNLEIYIATDPDREGEAIAWHVYEALKENKKINIKKISIFRSVFNEITKNAVLNAVKNPREIDMNLVDSQQARRALDYLVGFNISPILWKTVGGSGASAGRVQSVGLRMLCEREKEIFDFKPQEYWSIHCDFESKLKKISSELIQFNNNKLEKFSIKNEVEAKNITNVLNSDELIYIVHDIQKKQQQRSPTPPFSTSLLQQEASNKLGFSPKKTMLIAQKLYEGINIAGETKGLITYMRTDGIYVSESAIKEARNEILERFGSEFLAKNIREYKNKNKNAQEAHEAIRPTIMSLFPEENLKSYLTEDEFKLYSLIYKKMMASQMSNAVFDICNVFFISNNSLNIFKSSFSSINFLGYLKIYNDSTNNDENIEDFINCGDIKINDKFNMNNLKEKQHFTSYPPRYNEASLIKKMEEIGIGRPSTYASIISVLQDREYAKLEKKSFFVTIKGHIINDFLVNFFEKYVAYDFTAKMEGDLDLIASGDLFWKKLLANFWNDFSLLTKEVSSIKTSEIIEKISHDMKKYIFPINENFEIENLCQKCQKGKLMLKFSRYGYFLGCDQYPECDFIKTLPELFLKNNETNLPDNEKINLIMNSEENPIFENKEFLVYEKKGRFGKYLEINNKNNNEKKNISFPEDLFKKSNESKEILIENLCKLPFLIGLNKDTNKEVFLDLGRFGFYVFEGEKRASIKLKNPFEIELNFAIDLIKKNIEKQQKNTKEIDFDDKFGRIKVIRAAFGKINIELINNNFNINNSKIEIDESKKKFSLPKNLINFLDIDNEILFKFLESYIIKNKKKKPRKKKEV